MNHCTNFATHMINVILVNEGKMIIDRIRDEINSGDVIPKPSGAKKFLVKGWEERRGSQALIYTIPNRKIQEDSYQKNITMEEFETSYRQLEENGQFTRKWFNLNVSGCAKQGPCNFTTIGGIFELLSLAQYSGRGVYVKK